MPICKFLFQNSCLQTFKCRVALSIKSRMCFDSIRDYGIGVVQGENNTKGCYWHFNRLYRLADHQFALEQKRLDRFGQVFFRVRCPYPLVKIMWLSNKSAHTQRLLTHRRR